MQNPDLITGFQSFKQGLRDRGQFEGLFEFFPDINFYVKDEDFKFIWMNQTCTDIFGSGELKEFVGKTEFDFFPKVIANAIRKDDEMIRDTKSPVIDRVELIVDQLAEMHWVSTNKFPLSRQDGNFGGIMGTTRYLKKAESLMHPYQGMVKVINFIRENCYQEVEISTLAKIANLSVSHFNRRFKELFHLSPRQFILKLKIAEACKIIRDQPKTNLSEIAYKMGFYDQSYFNRQFNKFMGMAPLAYRKKFG